MSGPIYTVYAYVNPPYSWRPAFWIMDGYPHVSFQVCFHR